MQFGSAFGKVMVGSQYSNKVPVSCQNGKATYAELNINGSRPRYIKLQVVAVDVAEGAKSFAVLNGEATPMTEGTFTFFVPVEWDEDGIPRTRVAGQDNVDVILLMPDGQFVDVQCGAITRKGRFFLTAQQLWKGQVVRTRGEGNKVEWTYVPTDPIHAFPGSDYGAIWREMAESLLGRAREESASERKSRVKVASWQPPAISSGANGDGYREGIVSFFNMISGTGYIADVLGDKRFVHFGQIVNPADSVVPVLTPMSVVRFRPGNDDQGRPGVKSVRI